MNRIGFAALALGLCIPSSGLTQANANCSGSYRVYFSYEMSELTVDAKEVVLAAAAKLSQCPTAKATIAGHVDASETEKLTRLGLSRAVNVAAILTKNGIKRSRLKVTNARFASPARPTGPGVREPLNRRVEIDWK